MGKLTSSHSFIGCCTVFMLHVIHFYGSVGCMLHVILSTGPGLLRDVGNSGCLYTSCLFCRCACIVCENFPPLRPCLNAGYELDSPRGVRQKKGPQQKVHSLVSVLVLFGSRCHIHLPFWLRPPLATLGGTIHDPGQLPRCTNIFWIYVCMYVCAGQRSTGG